MNSYTERMKVLAQATQRTGTVHYFPDVDLRNAHKGLTEIAKKRGYDAAKLKAGEFVVFVNKDQTQVKLIGPNNVLVHLKTADSRTIEMEAIQLLPRLFNGTRFSVATAQKMGLAKAA